MYCNSSTSRARFQAGPPPPPVRILRPGRFVQKLLDMVASVPADRLIQVMNEVLKIINFILDYFYIEYNPRLHIFRVCISIPGLSFAHHQA